MGGGYRGGAVGVGLWGWGKAASGDRLEGGASAAAAEGRGEGGRLVSSGHTCYWDVGILVSLPALFQ